jgi:hypothetical protein
MLIPNADKAIIAPEKLRDYRSIRIIVAADPKPDCCWRWGIPQTPGKLWKPTSAPSISPHQSP